MCKLFMGTKKNVFLERKEVGYFEIKHIYWSAVAAYLLSVQLNNSFLATSVF